MPVIRDKGIRVQTIAIAFHHWNEPVTDISRQYDLAPTVVKEALAFYLAYKVVVDALIAENDALANSHG